jgi:hypothetical protein
VFDVDIFFELWVYFFSLLDYYPQKLVIVIIPRRICVEIEISPEDFGHLSEVKTVYFSLFFRNIFEFEDTPDENERKLDIFSDILKDFDRI